ncbi:SPOR domain-containing protein [Aurantiacibacter poecillastricola]|uniref:SPOR domain-containing protein n=1 Tax=Aurantiacibacter poecillastricola TaxID=3064385 RepID=UPI00273DE97F|nr:SPOR domain-containing protein [Aurantiacibacter sp. 219JJ12-13]MDP5262754.1 tetratricopeptide repeat protein [Aurantiacibacter sp. 219JJ12-13]
MYGKDNRNPLLGLGVSSAMAAVLLAGCTSQSMPRAEVAAADAEAALDHGRTSEAIRHAESAVAAEPRNAGYRLMLGNAYLEEGRFASASTSFEDAMTLGDNSPRAALSLALALTGEGRFAEASALLRDWEGEIAAPDLGLAFSLAGDPERGIHILSNAIRQGQNTAKVRQNLAYSYAVAGRWREARLMVSQDVPADQVGKRMEEWARMSHAEAYQHRVAGLLGVPVNVRDAGQPVHLALNVDSDLEQLAAEASGHAVAAAPQAEPVVADTSGELPAATKPEIGLDTYARADGAPPVNFAEAFAAPAPAGASLADVTTDTMRFVSSPVVQTTAARHSAAAEAASRPATRRARSAASVASAARAPSRQQASLASAGDPTHLVQLGSFSSEQGARRAWGIYVSRHPELANHEMVITQAVVRGKRYWRVSAGGFNPDSSRSMCSSVNSSSNGEGCITWAASSPLPGAIDNAVRLASR